MDVEEFGNVKREWLETFLDLPNGIPSHDTFGRFFAAIDAERFQQIFIEWIRDVYELTKGQAAAIDGKTLRRSHDKRSGKSAIHMAGARASANGVVLGQAKVDDKSNEITAMPELLDTLDVSGCSLRYSPMPRNATSWRCTGNCWSLTGTPSARGRKRGWQPVGESGRRAHIRRPRYAIGSRPLAVQTSAGVSRGREQGSERANGRHPHGADRAGGRRHLTLLTDVAPPPMTTLAPNSNDYAAPDSRRMTKRLTESLRATRKAIENEVGGGGCPLADAVERGVSANLCEALDKMVRPFPTLDVGVSWAKTRPMKSNREVVRFANADAHLLREAAAALRNREPYPQEGA